MKINFIPKTALGWWSVGLVIAVPLFLFIGMSLVGFYESIPAGRTILLDVIARPGIALPMLAGFVSGIVAFFTGIIGIIRKKDHSILIIISTAIGFLVLLWCVAEILFPH